MEKVTQNQGLRDLDQRTQEAIKLIRLDKFSSNSSPTFTIANLKPKKVTNMVSLSKSNVASMIASNVSAIPSFVRTKSFFKERAALGLKHENAQLVNLLPEDLEIYPICCYTYNEMIEIPVRGAYCTHYDVVDLEYLIREMEIKGWRCPICSKPLTLETICIDRELEKNLNQIRKESFHGIPADILLYSRIKNKFVGIASENFVEDFNQHRQVGLGLKNDYVSLIVDQGTTSVYNFLCPRLAPDTNFLEIPLHLNESKSEKKNIPTILIPVIIFGNSVWVNSIISNLVRFSQAPGFIKRYVVLAPYALNCSFEEKSMLINIAIKLNDSFGIIAVGVGGSQDFERHYEKASFSLYYKTYFAEDPSSSLKGDVNKSCSLEDLMRKIIKSEESEGFSRSNIDQDQQIKEDFSRACSKACQELKLKATSRQEKKIVKEPAQQEQKINFLKTQAGLLITVSTSFKDNYLESCQPIQFIPGIQFENEKQQIYKIRVPRISKELLLKKENLLVYFPNQSDIKNFVDEKIISIVSQERINSQTVIWPMMLSDCVVILFNESTSEIVKTIETVKTIVKAKKENPCLVGKEIFIFKPGINTEKDLKDFERLILDDKNITMKKDSQNPKKYFEWTLNIWLLVYEAIPPEGCAKILHKEFLDCLTSSVHYSLPFLLSKKESSHPDSNQKSDTSWVPRIINQASHQSLTSALQQRFSGIISKSVVFAKEETTLSEKIFTLVVNN